MVLIEPSNCSNEKEAKKGKGRLITFVHVVKRTIHENKTRFPNIVNTTNRKNSSDKYNLQFFVPM